MHKCLVKDCIPHRKDSSVVLLASDGDRDESGGGGGDARAGGGAACTRRGRARRTGSPEMPAGSARTPILEVEGRSQSDAARVPARGWGRRP